MSIGQLRRLGALTQPADTATHTTTPVKVIVQLAKVWEAWTNASHRHPFQDLMENLLEQDMNRVTVLYVSHTTTTLLQCCGCFYVPHTVECVRDSDVSQKETTNWCFV